MKIITDKTGRFRNRIYYDQSELDFECEDLITKLLVTKYGCINFPIKTDDISVLIEQKTSDFDMYADLSHEGSGIEGVTYFFYDKKPSVKISNELTEKNRENRLRTTLTHELGHAHFHLPLVSVDFGSPRLPFSDEDIKKSSTVISIKCNRDSILNAKQIDWVEWQAGYASGAFLMPITPLKQLVQSIFLKGNFPSKLAVNSVEGIKLIQKVRKLFRFLKMLLAFVS